jgi:hypothetical protein
LVGNQGASALFAAVPDAKDDDFFDLAQMSVSHDVRRRPNGTTSSRAPIASDGRPRSGSMSSD